MPFTQDKARSYIRQSNIDFLPSLVKPNKFMDSVEKLTIYVDKKNDLDVFENIVIKDTFNNIDSRIIYAKTGFFSQLDDQNFLGALYLQENLVKNPLRLQRQPSFLL